MTTEPTDAELNAAPQQCDVREKAFAREYVLDGNGTQAVLRTGCYNVTNKSAGIQAVRLLARPHVVALIEQLSALNESRAAMTQASVLSEMALLSHSDVGHYVIDDDGQVQLTPDAPPGAMRAIKSIKRKKTVRQEKGEDGAITITYDVELTLWDKPDPLKLMGRQTGLFPNKVEVTGKNGGPIEAVTRVERVIVDALPVKSV